MGMSEALVSGRHLNAADMDMVSDIQKSAASLLVVLSEVLEFANGFSPSSEFNVRALLHDTKTNADALRSGNTITVEALGSFPVALSGDSVRIGQILRNLVENALKFTRSGTVNVTVTVLTDLQFHNSLSASGLRVGREPRAGVAGVIVSPDLKDFKRHFDSPIGPSNVHVRFLVVHDGMGVEHSSADSNFVPSTPPEKTSPLVPRAVGLTVAKALAELLVKK
jgi:hypothetical protein